jgi:hypothetical protein
MRPSTVNNRGAQATKNPASHLAAAGLSLWCGVPSGVRSGGVGTTPLGRRWTLLVSYRRPALRASKACSLNVPEPARQCDHSQNEPGAIQRIVGHFLRALTIPLIQLHQPLPVFLRRALSVDLDTAIGRMPRPLPRGSHRLGGIEQSAERHRDSFQMGARVHPLRAGRRRENAGLFSVGYSMA